MTCKPLAKSYSSKETDCALAKPITNNRAIGRKYFIKKINFLNLVVSFVITNDLLILMLQQKILPDIIQDCIFALASIRSVKNKRYVCNRRDSRAAI
jgi:hypothetical protein